MRIAFLTMGRDIGGAKQDIITLSQKIAAKGHKVFVISSPGVMDKELEDTSVVCLPADFYTRSPWGLFKASRTLAKFVKEYNIELINPQGFFTAAIAWLSKWSLKPHKSPIVTTIHMFSSLSYYKYAWMLNKFSDKIITESNCERIRLEGGGTVRSSIRVINNSVDTERFSQENSIPVLRSEYQLGSDIVAFGIIARLSPEKSHEDYIAAAHIVHQQDPNTRFFIVGDGPTRESLMDLTKDLDYIIFTGARRDIPNVLRSLDCFVLCSKVESLPLSIREAMSMSLPTIVTDVGGNREIVAEGITGLLVPPSSPVQLANAMLKIVRNQEYAALMGKKARQYCLDRFDARDWAEYTEQEFEDVIKRSK